jgi:hypothetical protein
MWQTGTATDHLDLLTQLKKIATSKHVSNVVLNAAGTGYTAGDILSVAGGTSSHTAKIEVLTLGGGGAIATYRISVGGAYTVDPTVTGNAVTGGTGTGATFDLTMKNTGWTVRRRSQRVATATVSAGGTGYGVGNVLTLVGGLGVGSVDVVVAATLTVATLSGSAVATVTVTTKGRYEELPANPVAVTGGAGTGATFTITWEDHDTDDRILILEGDAIGMPAGPLVAFKAYATTNGAQDVRNWALFGLSSFIDSQLLHDQPSISRGFVVTGGGANVAFETTLGVPNVPLKVDAGSFPIKFWMSITDRRIVMVALCETATLVCYSSMYVGFLNQYGTESEIPYPILIMGCACKRDAPYTNSPTVNPVISSIVEAIEDAAATNGPGQFLDPSGAWKTVANYSLNGAAKTTLNIYNVFPFCEIQIPNLSTPVGDCIVMENARTQFASFFDARVGQTAAYELYASLDTGNPKRLLVPCSVLASEGTGSDGDRRYPFGEMDGVYWFSYGGGGVGAGPQDFFNIGGERYRVFQSGSRVKLSHDFFAVKEA